MGVRLASSHCGRVCTPDTYANFIKYIFAINWRNSKIAPRNLGHLHRVVWPSGLRGGDTQSATTPTTWEMAGSSPAVGTSNAGFLSGVSTYGFPV